MATNVDNKNKMSQKDKQKRGEKGESLITDSLRLCELWNHKLINAGWGTVFDKIVIPPGGGYALEIKLRKEPKIAFNEKSITPNERIGLDKFEKLVGRGHAHILGIWDENGVRRAFLIPWCQVRDRVLSGIRGSINMLDFPELRRKGTGWDLSCFKEGKP
jgi:hypothetical protein